MKVIIEEVEQNIARVINEKTREVYNVPLSALPNNYSLNTLYQVNKDKTGNLYWKILHQDTKEQLSRVKQKREALKRNKD